MNSRQKEVIGQSLADEKAVLKALTDNYTTALADIKKNIRELQANPLTQSKAYQLEYQKQLETMVSGVLDTLQGNNFNSIAEYLQNSYTNSYIGNLYDMHGQGVPLILPMNENQVVKAVQKTGDDFKLSEKLGGNTKELKKQVKSEMQRGLASALPYETMARSISDYGQADLNRSMRIARTEGHRIQTEAKLDCMNNAKKKGADIVKQWDSTLDGRTRPEHKQLDGQIREIDENFEVDGYSAQGPGGFGDPYMDCNCRCCLLQRAKWALDDDELKTLQDRAEYFGLDKSQNFQDFKDKYINAVEKSNESGIIKIETFNSKEDPMYEVMGSAFESNPKEVQEIIEQLKEWGVGINYGSSTLAYGCTQRGKPGTLSITKNASYSAWLHEFQHVKDDYEAGWNGLHVLWRDPKERIRRERRAYTVEKILARKLNRKDMVERLKVNCNEEIRRIIKKEKENKY